MSAAPTLVRRAGAQGPRAEYPQTDPLEEPAAEEQSALPKSRRVWFEIPEGFMATISLVPYTEAAADVEPALPPADPSLTGRA